MTAYIFTIFEALQGVRAGDTHYGNIAYAEATFALALRR
jgi:hypothetical protein